MGAEHPGRLWPAPGLALFASGDRALQLTLLPGLGLARDQIGATDVDQKRARDRATPDQHRKLHLPAIDQTNLYLTLDRPQADARADENPRPRLAAIIADVAPSVILVDRKGAAALPVDAPVLFIDAVPKTATRKRAKARSKPLKCWSRWELT